MEFGRRRDTTDTTDFCPRQLVVYVADLLWTCYGEVANLLQTFYGKTGVMDFALNTAEKYCNSDKNVTMTVNLLSVDSDNAVHIS